jgi:hypothetical protein
MLDQAITTEQDNSKNKEQRREGIDEGCATSSKKLN